MQKSIWNEHEISIASELTPLIPDLVQDFLNVHPGFYQGITKTIPYRSEKEYLKGTPSGNPVINTANITNQQNIWTVEAIRYVLPDKNIELNKFEQESVQTNFPTACALTKKYLKHCGCSSYSILSPNAKIPRHSDPENRDRRYVRLHIPLIIPTGNTFLEVNDAEVKWNGIFAFDNSLMHSAHNNTSDYRLIFLLDISRSFLRLDTI